MENTIKGPSITTDSYLIVISSTAFLKTILLRLIPELILLFTILIFFFLFLKNLFILFLAALGLCCCIQASSSCGETGATLPCGARASHCGGSSCCGARALGAWASVVVARGF